MKQVTKYIYTSVIQQYYGQGWEDVSEYESDSQHNHTERVLITIISKRTGLPIQRSVSLLSQDIKEYELLGYPTRIIYRKTLRQKELATA